MHITLICFSQTGNTRKVAGVTARAFSNAGHVPEIISLVGATPEDTATGELLGAGTPCFSGRIQSWEAAASGATAARRVALGALLT